MSDTVHIHSECRELYFRLETQDTWRVFIDTPAGRHFEAGTMLVVKDWQGERITSHVTLYRLGAGRGLYGMTAADEIQLRHDHLEFLKSTKRHKKRIEKAESRLEWLYRIAAAGHSYMDPNWNKARKCKRALLEYREGLRPLSFCL